MLVAGRRVVPWIMHYAAHTGSRELFRLSVYAVALGIAYGAAALFGVSFALGAFFAGMVLAESPLSQRATEEALPLRDAFAVLFFVSVGMLFDPGVLIRAPWSVLATVAIITVGKTMAAFVIVRAFGRPNSTALTISASLAQIGEFSFILAGLGVSMGVLPTEGRDLILAGAIISILLNPFLFVIFERIRSRSIPAKVPPSRPKPVPAAHPGSPEGSRRRGGSSHSHQFPDGSRYRHRLRSGGLDGRLRLAGGGAPGAGVREAGGRWDRRRPARRRGGRCRQCRRSPGAGGRQLPSARRLFVTVPEAFEAGQVVEQARSANPDLEIVARAHSTAAVTHLEDLGCSLAVMGEHEIAMRMLEHAGVDEAALSGSLNRGGL